MIRAVYSVVNQLRRARRYLAASLTIFDSKRVQYKCPICNYTGVFIEHYGRLHAMCVFCGALERHRIQALVVDKIFETFDPSNKSILHVAPEPFFSRRFKKQFKNYLSADLVGRKVNLNFDLTKIPFEDNHFDCVFASHVLEHIKEDEMALQEIYRVLRPGGIAFLPVPIVADQTIEYPVPVATEHGHVRAPGIDYFARLERAFDSVAVYCSLDFEDSWQTRIYEDRSNYPRTTAPYRPPQTGNIHLDYVPVCFKA